MLVLEGKGAAADAEAFRAAGIGDFDVFDFEREGKRPDGSTVKVAFSLAFAADTKAPDTGFFTCQQHYPENFWNPAFQKHANGVTGVAGVVFVAENPADHHIFLQSLLRRERSQIDVERHHHRDAARRNPGHGPGSIPAALRRGAAGRVARDAAGGDPVCGWRHRGCPRRSRGERCRADGQADRGAEEPLHGATFGVRDAQRPLVARRKLFHSLTEISGFSEITFSVRRSPFAMMRAVGRVCGPTTMDGPGLPPPQRPGVVSPVCAMDARMIPPRRRITAGSVDRRPLGWARSGHVRTAEPCRHCRKRALRQRAAARADRGSMRTRKPRACAGDGGGAEGDRRACRNRARLQDLVRQGEPHQRLKARAASDSMRRCRSSPRSAKRWKSRC